MFSYFMHLIGYKSPIGWGQNILIICRMKHSTFPTFATLWYSLYFSVGVILLTAILLYLPACSSTDDNYNLQYPNALVTVRPIGDSTFVMQLNDSVTLRASNLQKSPFGSREVRALVIYSDATTRDSLRYVYVNWIDSIRTKQPVPTAGADNDSLYGNDAIEIVRDWVTVAEDGYLTLRLRAFWGTTGKTHYINLLTGVNPDNPYEIELRHNANGDNVTRQGDALIAFNLNDLAAADDKGKKVKLTLRWKSSVGDKTLDIDLRMRPATLPGCPRLEYNSFVE